MSGSQKQVPSGQPQQQRYAQGPYVPRAPTPQRADGYHVTTQQTAYVQQQASNQPTNQNPNIRSMAPTGPPNQPSTPPQNDMKQMQQQTGPMPLYVQQQVRPGAQPPYYRAPTQNQTGPRLANHHRQIASNSATTQIFPQQMQYLPPMTHAFPMTMQYNAPRPQTNYYPTAYPVMNHQYIHSTFPAQQPQTQPYYHYQNPTTLTMPNRQGPPPPPVATTPQGAVQSAQPTMPIPQQMTQPNKRKNRSCAIPIIHPVTGKQVLDLEDDSQSGDSSARDTPQPSATNSNQMISAEFAARVAIVASEGKIETNESEPHQTVTYGAPITMQPPPQQPQPHNAIHMVAPSPPKETIIIESTVVQNSKLQASTKEFIPEIVKHIPKENTTPVVSANTDGVEVTLPNKQVRERESPAKLRRQPQQSRGDSIPKEQQVIGQEMQPPMVVSSSLKDSPAVVPIQQQHVVYEQPEPKVITIVNTKVKLAQQHDNKGPVVLSPPVDQPPPQLNSTPAPPIVDETSIVVNAKNKGSHKAKESPAPVQQQQQQQQQQQPSTKTMPVPGSQPAKSSSKGNKMRELNIKGANKEGTDMDAFNTPETSTVVENCNNVEVIVPQEVVIETPVPQPQPQPVIIPKEQPSPTLPPLQQQQQPLPPTTTTTPQVTPVPAQKIADNIKIMPKPKVDITSIVKEIPRPLKQQPPPPPPSTQEVTQQSTTESQDETDRAACEKLVQIKNETNNIKTNSSNNSDTQVIDKTLIRYKKDQWSPMNEGGKKCYDREFLINLQNNPSAKKKPDNLPDLEIVLQDNNRTRIDRSSFPLNRQTESLMPSFNKSLSQRGPLPKRNSQQGKTSSKSGKPNTIHVTLSLREEVKLRETENAWRPARLNSSQALTADELKTAELYKKVRGVLNKLTPEKFEKLLSQVRSLSIDNEERLQGVIDLVFEKAVDEPNFSVAYASMCKELASMQVPINKNKEDLEYVNFRKLLITRCQLEFEKNTQLENERNLKQKEIECCMDPEKKKELQLQLEEDERKMRVKSVGNIRFIGELFKINMLTVRIMLRCINILLDNKDEDSLECLCKLLTTIGKELELKQQDLQPFFDQMQEFVDKKRGKISSRVRFMLQDVIDLRKSNWVPRRQDLNPRTMEQIQKEADTEQINIQMNISTMTPRKDERHGGHGGGSGPSSEKRRSNQADEGGWQTQRNRTPYTVESSKLMNKPPPMEEMTLGSKNLFGQWGRGSNIKTQTHAPIPNTTNMYAALDNINTEVDKNRSSYDRMNKPYVSKGHSMDRTPYKQNYDDGRGSRSGSQHRGSASTNQPPQYNTKQVTPAQVAAPRVPSPPPVVPVKIQLKPEQLRLRIKNILEEYLNDCCSLEECEMDIRSYIELTDIDQFIDVGFNEMLERSSSIRLKTGAIFAHLVKCDLISLDQMCKSLKDVLSLAEDLIIDVPMLWSYWTEMILALVTDNVISLRVLSNCCEVLVKQGHAHKLFAQLLIQLVADKGPNYVVEIWNESGIRFTDFMPETDVEKYIKANNLDFLIGGAGTPVTGQAPLSWEQVYSKLSQLLQQKTKQDMVTDWITANVGDRIKEKQFVRKLVTAIIEFSIYNANNTIKLNYSTLRSNYHLLQRYIDTQENLELQCIFAVQSLVQKWEHPPGLLLNILEKLWEDGVLSTDCFLAWEKDTDPMEQEGKGVALKSLQGLFTAIKENDYETLSSTSDEA